MKQVPVVYQDGMMDMVDAAQLQQLIETDEIVKFQRGDSWVYPGIDPVRHTVSTNYRGPERRMVH